MAIAWRLKWKSPGWMCRKWALRAIRNSSPPCRPKMFQHRKFAPPVPLQRVFRARDWGDWVEDAGSKSYKHPPARALATASLRPTALAANMIVGQVSGLSVCQYLPVGTPITRLATRGVSCDNYPPMGGPLFLAYKLSPWNARNPAGTEKFRDLPCKNASPRRESLHTYSEWSIGARCFSWQIDAH